MLMHQHIIIYILVTISHHTLRSSVDRVLKFNFGATIPWLLVLKAIGIQLKECMCMASSAFCLVIFTSIYSVFASIWTVSLGLGLIEEVKPIEFYGTL